MNKKQNNWKPGITLEHKISKGHYGIYVGTDYGGIFFKKRIIVFSLIEKKNLYYIENTANTFWKSIDET